MADEDLMIVCSTLILVASVASEAISALNLGAVHKKRKRKHKSWVNRYLKDRVKFSTFVTLVPKLSNFNPERFFNFMRMDLETFEELFALVEPEIVRQRTKFRLVCLHLHFMLPLQKKY